MRQTRARPAAWTREEHATPPETRFMTGADGRRGRPPGASRTSDTLKDFLDVEQCAECGARFGAGAAFCPFDGTRLAAGKWDETRYLRPSSRVDDRYELLEPLGEGGMGTVYKVRHVTLDRLFAMKVLRRDLANDAELAQRFLLEARATAAIKHISVVAITDFGQMPDGVPYFVMELLEGETLKSRLRTRGPVAPEDAIKIGCLVAAGLEASHSANVIHRDLKPDNVFLVGQRAGKAPEDEVRIVDFGAAKIVGSSKLTRPGIVFGTPYYMSPEQASGQPIDRRADVYSLGVLLYEMLTGRVPFEADTYMGVLTKHMYEAPARPISPTGVQLGGLENVVMRALAKNPDDRYPSMTALVRALEQIDTGRRAAPGRGVSPEGGARQKTHRLAGQVPTTTADRIEASVDRRVRAEARRTRWTIVGAGAVCTALAVSAAFITAWIRTSGEASAAARERDSTAGHVSGGVPRVPSGSLASTPAPVAVEALPTAALENDAPEGVGAPPSPRPRPSPEDRRTSDDSPPTTPVANGVNSGPRRNPSSPPRASTTLGPAPSPAPDTKPSNPPQITTGHSVDDFKDPWKR